MCPRKACVCMLLELDYIEDSCTAEIAAFTVAHVQLKISSDLPQNAKNLLVNIQTMIPVS